ncbi:hypothetical protein LguiA_015713 [Lonicera macranthoides]
MICSLKALSRTVHEEGPYIGTFYRKIGDEEGACTTILTVWRKSLILSCNGFTVINSEGELVYRVDNYNGPLNEIILMDGLGNSILTLLRRKQKLRLVDNWDIYEGEIGAKSLKKKPICCARKQLNILRPSLNVIAHVHLLGLSDKSSPGFVVEGSYANRSCKVIDQESRRVVAEIRKKEGIKMGVGGGNGDGGAGGGVSFGLEVFILIIHPGFDPAFAMAIVLLLDQMFS